MAKEKILKQVLMVSVEAKGFVVGSVGPVENFYTSSLENQESLSLELKMEDFLNKEDYFTVMRLITQAVREKISK